MPTSSYYTTINPSSAEGKIEWISPMFRLFHWQCLYLLIGFWSHRSARWVSLESLGITSEFTSSVGPSIFVKVTVRSEYSSLAVFADGCIAVEIWRVSLVAGCVVKYISVNPKRWSSAMYLTYCDLRFMRNSSGNYWTEAFNVVSISSASWLPAYLSVSCQYAAGGRCIAPEKGWEEPKRQQCTLSIDIIEVLRKNDRCTWCSYWVCWWCRGHIGMAVGSDCKDDGFLRDYFMVDNVFTSILLAWASLRPLFPRQTSVLRLCWGALVCFESVCDFVSDFACRAESCTVSCFFEPSISAYYGGRVSVISQ